MGNCHKNRICEFFENHCPSFLLDCCRSQSIFSDTSINQNPNDSNRQQQPNDGQNDNNNQEDPNYYHYHYQRSEVQKKEIENFCEKTHPQKQHQTQQLPGQLSLNKNKACCPNSGTESILTADKIANDNNDTNQDDNESNHSSFIASVTPSTSSNYLEQHAHYYSQQLRHSSHRGLTSSIIKRKQQLESQSSALGSTKHLSHCHFNTTGLSITSGDGSPSTLAGRLKLNLQERLEMMHRQRSASHCPHTLMTDSAGVDDQGRSKKMHKCCCHKTQSSNIVVDPLIKSMASGNNSSGGGGSRKRASSLRVLNRRFNFFDHDFGNNNPDNHHNGSGNSSRRGSRKHHKRPQTKFMDLDDQCLLNIFEYLSLQEKLLYERVCHRWQRLIRRSLQAPVSLKIGEHSIKCNCQCAHYPSWDLPPHQRFLRDKSGYIVYPRSIIKYLLTLCNQLRCINFSHCYLDDQTLQIIIDHSDMIECLHLNDIRLEEDIDDFPPNGMMDNLSNGNDGNDQTLTSAVGAIGEQLAMFGGLMRKLSTRRSLKKSSKNAADSEANSALKRHSDASVASKRSNTSNWLSQTSTNRTAERCTAQQSRSAPPTNSMSNTNRINVNSGNRRTTSVMSNESSPLIPMSSMNRTTPNLSMVNSNTGNSPASNITLQTLDMRTSLENIVMRRGNNRARKSDNNSSHPPASIPSGTNHNKSTNTSTIMNNNNNNNNNNREQEIGQPLLNKAATQRRKDWSKHRTSAHNQKSILMSDEKLAINVIKDTMNSDSVIGTINDDQSMISGVGDYPSTTTTTSSNTTNNVVFRRHLSPNFAPNLSSLLVDHGSTPSTSIIDNSSANINNQYLGYSLSAGSGSCNSSNNSTNNQIQELSDMIGGTSNNSHSSGGGAGGTGQPHFIFPSSHSPVRSLDPDQMGKMDHVHAYVEQEQLRHELRQTHLAQWKSFAKKLGSQLRCLSLGSLSSVDTMIVDILLKNCNHLEELRINNEIDILSYLSIIKLTIQRIYINCEHGIGLECVSLLAYRNYAEKVISLGRVDVPPDLIDSVISTIGSNFCNLRSLHLRLHNFDIDVATPANLLFDNLTELNLQFVSGNVDQPFKKFIQLGWSSVRSLTIQYASITSESVRAIHEHMPQLKKLVLYAIEFRCDHLARRYGHRICTNCSHTVWKSIATLPNLTQLKLHRVIIDEEICKSLTRMHRLTNLELQYCSNVNDNIINVISSLARRNSRRRIQLNVVSRGFVTFNPPSDVNNLFIDVKVACGR